MSVRVTHGTGLDGLDVAAVREACDYLGLTEPVHVQRNRGRNGAAYLGILRLARGARKPFVGPDGRPESRHVISIGAGYYGAASLSRVLWHELAHAAQCEHWHGKDWRGFFREYNDALRAVRAHTRNSSQAVNNRYRSIKWERDSIEHEALADDQPLFGEKVVKMTQFKLDEYVTTAFRQRLEKAEFNMVMYGSIEGSNGHDFKLPADPEPAPKRQLSDEARAQARAALGLDSGRLSKAHGIIGVTP